MASWWPWCPSGWRTTAPRAGAAGNLREMMRAAIRKAAVPCEAFTDGLSVPVGDSDYEPDCIVRCG